LTTVISTDDKMHKMAQ